MENTEIFERELEFIKNESIKDFTSQILESLPDYFRKIGASTSGKFHPTYTLGEGGLIRHTKAAVVVAMDLFRADFYNFDCIDKDIVIASIILHDGLKCGMWEDHTAFNHPILIAERIKEFNDKGKWNGDKWSGDYVASKMTECVSSHMGKWNTCSYSDIILSKPKTDMQKCVHLCDYIASRKHLIFDFNVYEEEYSENYFEGE